MAQEAFTVIGHAVHQSAVTGEAGGNIGANFEAENGVQLRWLTYGVGPVHEQLFREASLSAGSVDAAFLLNRFANENVANLFEPLDAYLEADPIEDFEGISPGMLEAMTYDGQIYGIPFRHATHGLLYNTALLAERGLDSPPETFEELIEYAEQLTFTRDDGTQVYGLVLSGQGPSNIIDIVRAYGGDFLTADFELKAAEEGMVQAVTLLADLYQRGILPRESVSFTTEDATTFMQQGRAAMAIDPFSRYAALNDPERSNFPGQIEATAVPLTASLTEDGTVVPVKTEIWSLVIPRNAPNKELSWKFIKHLSTLDAAISGAVNGNGPTRSAAYQDPQVQAAIPYWEAEAAAVAVARVPLPGFSESARVDDIVKEEVQAVMLGSKTPEQAMQDVVARVTPLLP
ncbi:ABC transporter substrate-binding protein [Arsenicitalea aurantiaca]|nr:extracellular solute-binding protein [Arsenicitalea aurantiaca]